MDFLMLMVLTSLPIQQMMRNVILEHEMVFVLDNVINFVTLMNKRANDAMKRVNEVLGITVFICLLIYLEVWKGINYKRQKHELLNLLLVSCLVHQ